MWNPRFEFGSRYSPFCVCLFCINYHLVFFNIKNLLFSAVNRRVGDGSIIYQ